MSEWLPIESAPRDGTPFIATIEVQHIDGRKFWETDLIWCRDDTGEIHDDCDHGWGLDDYTHWQPLPPPPAKETGHE